jgi:hypothetical protein
VLNSYEDSKGNSYLPVGWHTLLKTGRQPFAAFQKGFIKIREWCPPVGRKDERELSVYIPYPEESCKF